MSLLRNYIVLVVSILFSTLACAETPRTFVPPVPEDQTALGEDQEAIAVRYQGNFLNERGRVVEGSVCNIYVGKVPGEDGYFLHTTNRIHRQEFKTTELEELYYTGSADDPRSLEFFENQESDALPGLTGIVLKDGSEPDYNRLVSFYTSSRGIRNFNRGVRLLFSDSNFYQTLNEFFQDPNNQAFDRSRLNVLVESHLYRNHEGHSDPFFCVNFQENQVAVEAINVVIDHSDDDDDGGDHCGDDDHNDGHDDDHSDDHCGDDDHDDGHDDDHDDGHDDGHEHHSPKVNG